MTATRSGEADRLTAALRVAWPGAVVLTVVALWQAREGSRVIAIASVVALVTIGVASWFHPAGVRSLFARVGSATGRAVSWVCFGAMGLFLVVVPWLVERIARVDPTASPRGWAVRDRRATRPGDPWSAEAVRVPTSVRFGRSASVVAVTVVLIGGAYGVSQAAASRLSGTLAAPLAFADDEWYPEYFDNINAINHSDLYEPLASVRVKQARTTHINVVDGKRVTWTPPPCSCRRVRVWVYGGSTTWGVGQRDGHTIPSELARAAWADGVALEVENRGVGGDAHWEEAQRFAWDLANEPPPDLAIFYDGINEVLSAQAVLDPLEPPSQVPPLFWKEYLERFPNPVPVDPDVPVFTPPEDMSAREWGERIGERYERSRRITEALATQFDVPVAYFWQPSIEHREPIEGEPDDGGREWARERSDAMLATIGSEVDDLTRVFDGIDRALLYDGIHTNEEGARIVGEEVYARLGSTLRTIDDDGGPGE